MNYEQFLKLLRMVDEVRIVCEAESLRLYDAAKTHDDNFKLSRWQQAREFALHTHNCLAVMENSYRAIEIHRRANP